MGTSKSVLEVGRYGPVRHIGTSLASLKPYCHFFLTTAIPICRSGSFVATKRIFLRQNITHMRLQPARTLLGSLQHSLRYPSWLGTGEGKGKVRGIGPYRYFFFPTSIPDQNITLFVLQLVSKCSHQTLSFQNHKCRGLHSADGSVLVASLWVVQFWRLNDYVSFANHKAVYLCRRGTLEATFWLMYEKCSILLNIQPTFCGFSGSTSSHGGIADRLSSLYNTHTHMHKSESLQHSYGISKLQYIQHFITHVAKHSLWTAHGDLLFTKEQSCLQMKSNKQCAFMGTNS